MEHGSERDIQVLTVKDGEGNELRDARFVEIMKSARNRIKSAASIGEYQTGSILQPNDDLSAIFPYTKKP